MNISPADSIPILISLASFIFAVFAFRSSRPRVSVSLSSAILIDQGGSDWDGRSAVILVVTNSGASPVQLQGVELVSRVGRLQGRANPQTLALPSAIEANGGRGTWLFDRNELRALARRDGGEEQVQFRGVIISGRTHYRSRSVEVVHPLEPQKLPNRKALMAVRLRRWVESWTTPRVQPDLFISLDSVDLVGRTYGVEVRNHGGGVARGVTLELMREREEVNGQSRMERIIDPIPVGWVLRNRSRVVRVPLQEEAGRTWWLRYKGQALSGVSAQTRHGLEKLLKDVPNARKTE